MTLAETVQTFRIAGVLLGLGWAALWAHVRRAA